MEHFASKESEIKEIIKAAAHYNRWLGRAEGILLATLLAVTIKVFVL